MAQVLPVNKTSVRSVHPFHPASMAVSKDSGSIVVSRPGQTGIKQTTGTQTGATKEGEVFGDFN